MESRSRFQKVDTNNNNEVVQQKITPKSSAGITLTTTLKSSTQPSENGDTNKTNIRTSRRNRFEAEKQTAVVNNVGNSSSTSPTVSLTMNGQPKQHETADKKVNTVRMSTALNGNADKPDSNKTDSGTPSWAQKNKTRTGIGANKFGTQVRNFFSHTDTVFIKVDGNDLDVKVSRAVCIGILLLSLLLTNSIL